METSGPSRLGTAATQPLHEILTALFFPLGTDGACPDSAVRKRRRRPSQLIPNQRGPGPKVPRFPPVTSLRQLSRRTGSKAAAPGRQGWRRPSCRSRRRRLRWPQTAVRCRAAASGSLVRRRERVLSALAVERGGAPPVVPHARISRRRPAARDRRFSRSLDGETCAAVPTGALPPDSIAFPLPFSACTASSSTAIKCPPLRFLILA
jgi:hypothetical protein